MFRMCLKYMKFEDARKYFYDHFKHVTNVKTTNKFFFLNKNDEKKLLLVKQIRKKCENNIFQRFYF